MRRFLWLAVPATFLALLAAFAPTATADPLLPCSLDKDVMLEDGSQIWYGVCTNIFDPSDPVYPCSTLPLPEAESVARLLGRGPGSPA